MRPDMLALGERSCDRGGGHLWSRTTRARKRGLLCRWAAALPIAHKNMGFFSFFIHPISTLSLPIVRFSLRNEPELP
jgi:hypothetical protein